MKKLSSMHSRRYFGGCKSVVLLCIFISFLQGNKNNFGDSCRFFWFFCLSCTAYIEFDTFCLFNGCRLLLTWLEIPWLCSVLKSLFWCFFLLELIVRLRFEDGAIASASPQLIQDMTKSSACSFAGSAYLFCGKGIFLDDPYFNKIGVAAFLSLLRWSL